MLRRTVTHYGSSFPRMLEPLTLNNGITLKNRVVMGSMHTGLEEAKSEPYPKMAAFFGERAVGGTGLMVTGGVAPNWEGKVHPFAGKMATKKEAQEYEMVTDTVHRYDGKILMQVLHAGRYAFCPFAVAPSAIASPIWKFGPMKPIAMPKFWIKKTVRDFANCAVMAKLAGFDGIELMASEGYLLNEFIVNHTNKRTDAYGGSYENRIKFPLEVLKAIREATGPDFIIMTRISMLDLIPKGSSQDEVFELAERVAEHANIINTGIGWHEARVPTIATSVPRAAFTWVTKRVKDHLVKKGINVPLMTTNRINTPVVAEQVLQNGDADLISMARPMLADPFFVKKAQEGRDREISVCIGCNQACLDHVFKQKTASCLMNPVACHELELSHRGPRATSKHYIIIGAGPAGCHAAITLAEQGQRVTLYEATSRVGGQFHLAKQVPGKEEYESAIKYWETMINKYSNLIDLRLHAQFDTQHLLGFQEPPCAILLAAGCSPKPKDSSIMAGLELNPVVCDYYEVLTGRVKVGKRVAIIGMGGIGFDVAVFLTHQRQPKFEDFARTWGIDTTGTVPGGLLKPHPDVAERELYMFQRKKSKPGATLGATTGWIHRTALKHQNVMQISGVTYSHLDGNTLHYSLEGKRLSLKDLDNVILCAGQKSNKELMFDLKNFLKGKNWEDRVTVRTIGGADVASELDAKRAIRSAHELCLSI